MWTKLFKDESGEYFTQIDQYVGDAGEQETTFLTRYDEFDKFVDLIDQFECDKINIMGDCLTGGRGLAFSHIKKRLNIRKISFNSVANCPQFRDGLDPTEFQGFDAVEFLSVYAPVLQNGDSYFPNVKFLNLDWSSCSMKSIDQCWPSLTTLRLEKFKGSLSDLGNFPEVEELSLFSGNLENLEGLACFPNLKTLVLDGHRKTYDVGPLKIPKKLTNLIVRGAPLLSGWEELHLSKLRHAMINKLHSTSFFDINPQIEFLTIKNYSGSVSPAAKARGWTKIDSDYGWGIGGEYLPVEFSGR